MEKRIDLHIHTNISDGSLSPREVIDMASLNGVSVIAIADHDTVDAYNDELFDYAKEKNITLIPAVEISTKWKKCGIHVLGYNIDLENKKFRECLKKLCNARHDYLYAVSEKLNELGYVIDVLELDKIEVVTKAHIASSVISNKENEKLLVSSFGYIPSKGEFIENIMNEECPCYVKKNTISPKEAVKLIREATGVAVLAHPVAYKYEDNLSEEDILELVREMGIDAIEANYIYISRDGSKINECKKWRDFASKHNLVCFVGSDFHNDDGIHPVIGFNNCELDVSEEDVSSLLNYLLM